MRMSIVPFFESMAGVVSGEVESAVCMFDLPYVVRKWGSLMGRSVREAGERCK